MKRTLTLAVLVVIGHSGVSAQRAVTPADATVFIRLVGSMRADVEEVGAPRQTAELTRVEIGTGSGFVISPHGYVLTNEHVVSNTQFVVTDGLRKATFTLKVERIAACFPAGVSGGSGPSRCFDASVHSSDAVLDLAVLFIGAADLPYDGRSRSGRRYQMESYADGGAHRRVVEPDRTSTGRVPLQGSGTA
jgi:S1-C subfamily serine protease